MIEHDRHQGLHARHAGGRMRDRAWPFPPACAARDRSPAHRRCPIAAPATGRRDGAPRAPAGSSAAGFRAGRNHRPRRSDDAASPRRWRYPCWRRAAAFPRRSRHAAHGCACRLGAPGASRRSVREPRGLGIAPDGMARRDRRRAVRSCAGAQAEFVLAVEGGAARDVAPGCAATPSSSSTSSSPVDEPMKTLTPAQPGSCSSSASSPTFSRVPPMIEGEIAIHAVAWRGGPCRQAPRP